MFKKNDVSYEHLMFWKHNIIQNPEFQNGPECSRMFQNVPERSRMLQNVKEYTRMFQNYTAMQNCGAIPTNGLVGGGASRVFAQPRAQGAPPGRPRRREPTTPWGVRRRRWFGGGWPGRRGRRGGQGRPREGLPGEVEA